MSLIKNEDISVDNDVKNCIGAGASIERIIRASREAIYRILFSTQRTIHSIELSLVGRDIHSKQLSLVQRGGYSKQISCAYIVQIGTKYGILLCNNCEHTYSSYIDQLIF